MGGLVTIFMIFICIWKPKTLIWVSNEVKWRSRATWWCWFRRPNKPIKRFQCTGASQSVWLEPLQASQTLDLEITSNTLGVCLCLVVRGGVGVVKAIPTITNVSSLIWEHYLTTVQFDFDCKYMRTKSRALCHSRRRLPARPPVRLSLVQASLLIPPWTDGGIRPWCGSRGKGDRRMAERKEAVFTHRARTDKGFNYLQTPRGWRGSAH